MGELENNITLRPGTLYFMNEDSGKWEILSEVKEYMLNFTSEEYVEDTLHSVLSWKDTYECTLTMEMAGNMVRDCILSLCPNPRVVHLAKHSKKKRVRNKNYNRAIKIICKQGGTK